MNEQEALMHVCAMIDKLRPSALEAALEEIDLGDDAWEEAIQVLKDKAGWVDDTVSETDEE